MKFKYLIFGEDYSITGTNDKEIAEIAAEYEMVVNVETGMQLNPDEEIKEVNREHYINDDIPF